jgi:hypothetical protein
MLCSYRQGLGKECNNNLVVLWLLAASANLQLYPGRAMELLSRMQDRLFTINHLVSLLSGHCRAVAVSFGAMKNSGWRVAVKSTGCSVGIVDGRDLVP